MSRQEHGRGLRKRVPRGQHAELPSFERDVVGMVEASNAGRLPELVPIRYGRMLRSPFTFFRGTAGLMAHDLAQTPTVGLHVQLCGDCHLLNFGTYGTPERNLVFDINDFDETLPGPFEWDVKRLATSFVIAARYKGFSGTAQRRMVRTVVSSYRKKLADYAALPPLDVWYEHISADDLLRLSPEPAGRAACERMVAMARKHSAASLLTRLVEETADGALRLKDDPPLFYHVEPPDVELTHLLEACRLNLQDNRGALLRRYHLADSAIKVVGVGSVGTRCLAALLLSDEGQPLVLQLKEAQESVLAPFAGRSHYACQGKRVVEGQRLMQAATDVFLSWAHSDKTGIDYYVRQMRDWKGTIDLESLSKPVALETYANLCGWTLARAHARASGQAAELSGYLGRGESFDEAIVEFATAYADQNEKDYQVLQAAARTGRFQVAKVG